MDSINERKVEVENKKKKMAVKGRVRGREENK